jgi:hypothetical protein
VKRVISAYDGFYDITGVRPGRYRLRVEFTSAAEAEIYRRGTAPSVGSAAGPVRRLWVGARASAERDRPQGG